MKVFCFIFSLYLLILSWQPCQDLAKPTNFHPSNIYAQTDIHHTQDQSENDECSPFCICSCCQTSFTSNNFEPPKISKLTVKISQKTVITYKNPYDKNYNSDIWQPPKNQS